jgi:hypothetical protein
LSCRTLDESLEDQGSDSNGNDTSRLKQTAPNNAALVVLAQRMTDRSCRCGTKAARKGDDGIKFLPNPEDVPDPVRMETALQAVGAAMPVVNTGRMSRQAMALPDPNVRVRRQSIEAYKRILENT